MNLAEELKRRNVFRVGIFYAVLSWLILQVADVLFGITQLPDWSLTLVAAILALGFVPALVFAWVFEMTSEGLKLERDIDRSQSVTHHTARKLDIAVIVMLVAAAVVFLVDRISSTDGQQPPTEAPIAAAPDSRDRSIAVLPFADMSQAGDQGYFADGISEEILNALTRLPNLKVAGRTSSFKFRNVEEDLRQIGEQLGVAHILEGSVRKTENRVRVTVQLIETADGFHLWSETFDRNLSDIFAIQDQISRAVAEALSVKLDIKEATWPTSGTSDVTAHDLYFRARKLLASRDVNALAESIKLFEAATVLDPEFENAWSGLARAYALTWTYLGYASNEQATAAAQRAVVINPENAEAYSVLSVVSLLFDWDWEMARSQALLAVKYGPNNAEVVNFAGDVFRQLTEHSGGLQWEQRAADLDPLHPVNHSDLAWTYLTLDRCEEAEQASRDSLRLNPQFPSGLDTLARAQICLGKNDAARIVVTELQTLMEERWYLQITAALAVADGRLDDARAAAARLTAYEGQDFALARIYAPVGDHEEAARRLELAYRNRDPFFVADESLLLPEDWPDHPAIRAALDKPELNALFEIRRRNLAGARTEGANE